MEACSSGGDNGLPRASASNGRFHSQDQGILNLGEMIIKGTIEGKDEDSETQFGADLLHSLRVQSGPVTANNKANRKSQRAVQEV